MHRHGPQTYPYHDLQDSHEHSHIQRDQPDKPEPTTIPLSRLAVGSSCVIHSIGGEGALRRRLLDMGLTPKTLVTLSKTAPLGDPLELSLRGYTLSLRKDDASLIQVVAQ